MKAAVITAPHEMIVGQQEVARPGAGEILVKVNAAGICAGDMYIYQGKNPYATYPVVGGHEVSGMVAELGAGVNGPVLGTSVVVEPFIGCGRCYPCRVGKSNCCANLKVIGVHHPGGYAEYLTAPAPNIHAVPAGVSPLFASFAEPVAIGVQACRRGEISAGELVLILGCGPIGLALIEVVKAYGAHPVAADLLPSRLETAATLGAQTLLADEHLLGRVLERTDGEGAPVVIEATGNPKAMEQTAALVAAGGRIVIVGLVKQGIDVAFPGLDFTRKEMTIVGSRASVDCFPQALELLASGHITYPHMATTFSMWDAPVIFAELDRNPGMVHKGVLTL
ncbi:MAG: alcohol dehydrogenase catalytic domain-containing protein [Caldilineaceae bacterium]|nr:alcohol dehydrogenase catalytic domain-containing protein [Caldilineaceae bacterium]